MLSIEDLMTHDYNLYAEQQGGLLSHLHALMFRSHDGEHEGMLTLTPEQARTLKLNARQIITACIAIMAARVVV